MFGSMLRTTTRPAYTLERFKELLERTTYLGFTFEALREDTHYFLRVGDREGRCNVTGTEMAWWGRKWRLSPRMTDGEVISTAFKAVLTALEHEARECFLFDGEAVYDSHVDIHKLVALRKDPEALTSRPSPTCPCARPGENIWTGHREGCPQATWQSS